MSPEERKLLEEVAALSRDNHRLLQQIHRALRWRRIALWIKWGAIILISFGAYYYIQPWLDQLIQIYGSSLLPGLENLKSINQSLPGL